MPPRKNAVQIQEPEFLEPEIQYREHPEDLFESEDAPSNRDIEDVVNAVFSTSNINVKTVLDNAQIVAVARGLIYAQKYNSTTMAAFVQTVLELRISNKGLGRKNLIQVLRSALSRDIDDEKSDNLRRKLLG